MTKTNTQGLNVEPWGKPTVIVNELVSPSIARVVKEARCSGLTYDSACLRNCLGSLLGVNKFKQANIGSFII